MWGIALGLVVVAVTALWLHSRQKMSYWAKKGVIVPSEGLYPIIGHLFRLFLSMKPRWLFMDAIYRKHRDSKFLGCYEMWRPIIIVQDPELIKHITVKDFDHFVDRRTFKLPKGEKMFEEMLTMAKGDHWKGIRSVMTPTFTSGKMKSMFHLITAVGENMLTYCDEKTKLKKNIALKDMIGRYTMDNIASCAFGIDCGSFKSDDAEFPKVAAVLFTPSPKLIIKFAMFTFFPWISSLLGLRLFTDGRGMFFKDVVVSTMEEREKSGKRRGDFLDLMGDAWKGKDIGNDENATENGHDEITKKPPKYPIEYNTIIAQSVLFLLAGYDTTANTLTFALHSLATNPEKQQKLREEIRMTLEKHGSLTYDAVMNAEYTEAVVDETLRLYPPAHFLERLCTKEYKVPETDLTIPKGMIALMPSWSLHHDERYFDNPEEFMPERFLPENKANIIPYTFMPFGLGPRNCIAKRFAQLEAKHALMSLVHNFEIKPAPGFEKLETSGTITVLRPKIDPEVIFTRLEV